MACSASSEPRASHEGVACLKGEKCRSAACGRRSETFFLTSSDKPTGQGRFVVDDGGKDLSLTRHATGISLPVSAAPMACGSRSSFLIFPDDLTDSYVLFHPNNKTTSVKEAGNSFLWLEKPVIQLSEISTNRNLSDQLPFFRTIVCPSDRNWSVRCRSPSV